MNAVKLALATVLGLAFLIGVSARQSAEADEPAWIRSTIPANDPQPTSASITAEIAADYAKKATNAARLEFSTATIPTGGEIESCAIRVVTAKAIEEEKNGGGTGIRMEARQPSDQTRAFAIVPADAKENRRIILQAPGLCAALRDSRQSWGKTGSVTFELTSTTRNSALTIYMKNVNDPTRRPRLMLTYRLPEVQPAEADWGQIRHDAQHSGRSSWAMYDDPAGDFAQFQIRRLEGNDNGKAIAQSKNLPQSPLLFDGMLLTAIGPPAGVAEFDRTGKELANTHFVDPNAANAANAQPASLAAGPGGWLYEGWQNGNHPSVEVFNIRDLPGTPSLREIPIGGTEALLGPPTAGADGSVYVVTDTFVHAYSSPPNAQELWRYPVAGKASAVTLSKDEAVAYVLIADAVKLGRLVALDSATGDCRWSQTVGKIRSGVGEPMPIPVVAGQEIYFTNHYPRGDILTAVRDREPGPPGEDGKCPSVADEVAEKNTKENTKEYSLSSTGPMSEINDVITTPVADRENEAVWIQQNKLCWARGLQQTQNCGPEIDDSDIGKAVLLIGDSSGVEKSVSNPSHNRTRYYALAPSAGKLYEIIGSWTSGSFDYTFGFRPLIGLQEGEQLGPNLILGSGGTLYDRSTKENMLAIEPVLSTADALLKIDPGMVGMVQKCAQQDVARGLNNNTTFRAGVIETVPDLCLPAGTDIILTAASCIRFAEGFTVKAGARLRAGVGLPSVNSAGASGCRQ